MVKKTSYVFVFLLTTIVMLTFATIVAPGSFIVVKAINLSALALFVCGIVLIIALILDRYRDYKKESDDYKKY